MSLRSLFLLLWLLAVSQTVAGQQWSFQHFSRAQGLSDHAVTAIAEDSLGFLWVGTRMGLNRLEGQRFRSFFRTDGGLAGNIVTALQAGRDSRLWIGTSRGLCVYDAHTDSITPVTHPAADTGQEIIALGCDAEGNLWVRFPATFCRLNVCDGSCRLYACEDYFYPTQFLTTRAGELWMTAWDGTLRRYDAARDTFDTCPVLTAEEVQNQNFLNGMAETASGQLFIATRNGGARLFSPLTGTLQKLFTTDTEGHGIYIHRVLCDRQGEVWIGTENGIYLWNVQQGLHAHLRKDLSRRDALADNAVHVFHEDAAGGVWVGTFFGGLCHVMDGETGFRLRQVTAQGGMPVGCVVREMALCGGRLWVTTEDCGLCLLDDADGPLETVGLTWQGKAVTRNVQTVLSDGQRLWIGTFDEGIYWVDAATRRVTAHFTSTDASGLCNLAVVRIVQTSKGDVLAGTMDGLCRYDGADGRFHLVRGLEHGSVHDICQGSDGDVWVATSQSGLFRVTGAGAAMRAEHWETGLMELTTVAEDHRHRLLIGTPDDGYRVLDTEGDTLSAPRLRNTGVCRFLRDTAGRIWITTTHGLFCYQPDDESYVRFGTADGLVTDRCSFNSGYVDADGRIYVGTMAGLVDFQPLSVGRCDREPVPRFIMLEPQHRSLLAAEAVTLEHDASFSVEYATTCHTTSQPLWFRYRLEGTQEEWTVTQDMTPITFNSLKPGHYTLQLQAAHDGQRWTGGECRLQIRVRQPWWWTWWARMAYVLVLAGVAALAVRVWMRRQRERQRLSAEQADATRYREVLQSKINFFTAITHEIRTPLTLITGSLARLRRKGVTDDIEVLQRNTDRLLALVNQLMDFRKIESSAFLMNFEEVDMESLVRNIFENFRPLARQRNVDYKFVNGQMVNGQMVNGKCLNGKCLADREALTKIVSNLLSNALKFCDKYVCVTLTDSGHQVHLVVSNDGPLIPPEQVQEIFKPFHQYYGTSARATINGSGLGLSLARSLAEMHGGTLTYDTQDRTQNTFVLTLNSVTSHAADSEVQDKQPAPEDAADRTSDEPSASTAQHASHLPVVLLVDDERDLRHFVSEELAGAYEILEADNGEEALQVLKEKDVALVVTDLMMPVMDGTALCHSIRADVALCHIPIVVLTAKVSLQDHIDVLNCGADAYIEKPFATLQLMAQIANLLNSREMLRQTFVRSPYARPATVTANPIDQKFLTQLNEYLNSHLADPDLNVEALAAQMNMSISTFYRKVKAVTSLAPLDYIRLCRLKRGAELLAEQGMRVKEVAERLGFSSTTYFATCFMRQFGMTPSEFMRAQH